MDDDVKTYTTYTHPDLMEVTQKIVDNIACELETVEDDSERALVARHIGKICTKIYGKDPSGRDAVADTGPEPNETDDDYVEAGGDGLDLDAIGYQLALNPKDDGTPDVDYVNELAKKWAAKLYDSMPITYLEPHRQIEKVTVLGGQKIASLVTTFFQSWMGTVATRMLKLAEESPDHDITTRVNARNLSTADTPQIVVDLWHEFMLLKVNDQGDHLRHIKVNLSLVSIMQRWSRIRGLLNAGTSDRYPLCEGRDKQDRQRLMDWLESQGWDQFASQGRRNEARALRVLQRELGVDESVWGRMTYNAAIPYALFKAWGHGALMLLPPNKTNDRGSIPEAGTAVHYFNLLKKVDEDGAVQQLCDLLKTHIVEKIMLDQPLNLTTRYISGPVDRAPLCSVMEKILTIDREVEEVTDEMVVD